VDERPPDRQHAVRNVFRVTAGLVAATAVTLRQLIIVATHAIRARRVVVGRRSF